MKQLNEQAELYLSGMSPMTAGKIRKSLEKWMTLNRLNAMTRADHALRLYEAGYRMQVVRDEFRLTSPDGTFYRESDVTKALCDFVVWLTYRHLNRPMADFESKHPADGLGEVFTMDEFNQSIRQ
jgi:hypothetical protein